MSKVQDTKTEKLIEMKIHLDDLLDEALMETFPASDPISITVPHGQDDWAHKVHKSHIEKPEKKFKSYF